MLFMILKPAENPNSLILQRKQANIYGVICCCFNAPHIFLILKSKTMCLFKEKNVSFKLHTFKDNFFLCTCMKRP